MTDETSVQAPSGLQITKDQLKTWSACAEGYRWFLEHFPQGGDYCARGRTAMTDYQIMAREQQRAAIVAQSDTDRRCSALEAACRYEVEQHGKTRALMAHLELCRVAEVRSRDQMLAARERRMMEQSAEIGALRHQLAAAMRMIDSWTADRTPALALGLRRCDATFRGIDLVVDYDVVPGIDDDGEDCEAAETVTVWLGATNVSELLSEEADDSLSEQAQQALDDWVADERDELAVAGVPSLRDSVEA